MSTPGAARVNHRALVAWRFGAETAGRGAAFLLFPLLARHLGAEGVGVQAQAVAVAGLLVPLATAGLGLHLVRLLAGREDLVFVGTRLTSVLLFVGLVASALALPLALSAAWLNEHLLRVPGATAVMRLSALLVVAGALHSILLDHQRARLRIVAAASVQIAEAVLLVTAAWLVLALGGGLMGVVWVLVATRAVAVIMLLLSIYRAGDLGAAGLIPAAELMAMVRCGAPLLVIGLSGWVLSLGDRIVIGYFGGAADVGVYSAAYALAALLGALGGPFWSPLYPLMASARNRDQQALVAAVSRRYAGAFLILGLPAVVGLTVIAPDVLQLLGTAEFRVSISLFAFIAFALFLEQLSTPVYYLIYLHDDSWALRNRMLGCGALNLALNVVLIPVLGLTGAALATLLAYVLLDVLLLRRVLGYGYRVQDVYDVRRGRPVLGATAVMVIVVGWVHGASAELPAIAMTVCLGAATYMLVLFAGCGFRPQRLLAR